MIFTKKWFYLLTVLLIVMSCKTNPSKLSTIPALPQSEEAFVAWATKSHTDFECTDTTISKKLMPTIAADIGDAQVVVLSEGFHNCEEMLQLQYHLIQYLVTQKGFNTIVTESGFPESKHINNYVHGQDSIPNMWQNSIGKMYSEWQTGRQLIDWLRLHNDSSRNHSVVDYIGADIGGFYNNWAFAFEPILTYLDSVDTIAALDMRADFATYLHRMKKHAAYYYTYTFDAAQCDSLAQLLDKWTDTFSIKKHRYITKSNVTDYAWNTQCLQSMVMAEQYYRNYKDRIDSTTIHQYVGLNGREIAMAENIRWIKQQKKNAKIIVINHVVHTKTATQYQSELYGNFTPMGQLLQQQLNEKIYTIGMVYGSGQYWKTWQVPSKRFADTIPPSKLGGLEQTLQKVTSKNYYINWENVPLAAKYWLMSPTSLRENDYFIQLRPNEWNATFYLQQATPAIATKK